jgi:hypothetical protein
MIALNIKLNAKRFYLNNLLNHHSNAETPINIALLAKRIEDLIKFISSTTVIVGRVILIVLRTENINS